MIDQNVPRDGAPPSRVSRDLLGEKVAEVIRHRIVSGEYSPGTRLVEAELAHTMGTSRGPLRDALSLLGREGLVAATPGRGTYVRGLTEEYVHNLFGVRSVLEEYAASLAAQRIKPDTTGRLRELIEEMRRAVRDDNLDLFVRVDLRIHRAIWEISGNDRLVDVLSNLIKPCGLIVRLNAESYRTWDSMLEMHERLVDAIASQDGAVAAAVMKDHLAGAMREALSVAQVRSAAIHLAPS